MSANPARGVMPQWGTLLLCGWLLAFQPVVLGDMDDLNSIVVAPPVSRVLRHAHGEKSPPATTIVPPEKLVYSNTQGTHLIKFNVPNRRYADDLETLGISGCSLTRYEVRVNGGVAGGTGSFGCTVGLFTDCPGVFGGGVLISGTDFDFPGLVNDSSIMHDLEVELSAHPIPLPANVWIRVSCNTAASGWVGGAASEIGYTEDRFYHPSVGCNASLGASIYAGLFARVYVDDTPGNSCDTVNCVPVDVDTDHDGVPDCEDICPGINDAIFGQQCVGAIPTVSEWGLVVLALLLLIAAKIGSRADVDPDLRGDAFAR